MGMLVDGVWHDVWYDTKATKGHFQRSASQFRNWITPDGAPGPSGEGGFAAEAGRYHLYVSLACPWAHRTLIFRKLKKLEDLITVSVVDPLMLSKGWEFKGELSDPTADLENPLDQWIVSRVHQLNKEVEVHMDAYDIPNAVKPILPFIEDASNWYVRRSRRRFWKSGDDTDKNNAYRTLHYVLTHLAQVMAPFTPFLAEELYQKLTGGESVHLLDWPKAGHVNELVVKDMETVREYVNLGLSIRAKERTKVRQPLASVTVPSMGEFVDFEDILTEELNVKSVKQGKELALDLTITPELKREGLMREVIRHVQNARKNAGLNVDDHIVLGLTTPDTDLAKAISEHKETIIAETLADSADDNEYEHTSTVKVEAAELRLSLQKA